MIGCTSAPERIIQLASVARGRLTPMRLRRCSWRYNGSASAYFEIATYASVPGEALDFGIGCDGRGAVVILPAHFHVALHDIPMFGLRNPWLWIRIPFQAVFIVWAWRLSRHEG